MGAAHLAERVVVGAPLVGFFCDLKLVLGEAK